MGCKNTTTVDVGKVGKTKDIFEPFQFGELKLKNRVVMAAMSRNRSDNGIPNNLMAKYYTERAEDAGIIITECIPVSRIGCCKRYGGGGYTQEHIDGWKKVVESVHKVGGKIIAQVYHCGRVATKDDLDGLTPVSCSAIKNRFGGKYDIPHELSIPEIESTIMDFAKSAALLKTAGFDGIQLHGSNGYLIDQFLRDATNTRNDKYGGSIENRSRFLLEVIDELIKVFGSKRIGLKIAPVSRINDMYDSNPQQLLEYLLPQLSKRKICFVEIIQPPDSNSENLYGVKGEDQIPNIFDLAKPLLKDVALVGNNGLTLETARKLLSEGKIDAVSFARYYMANPDVVARMKNDIPLSNPEFQFAYTREERGYCDYPKYKLTP